MSGREILTTAYRKMLMEVDLPLEPVIKLPEKKIDEKVVASRRWQDILPQNAPKP